MAFPPSAPRGRPSRRVAPQVGEHDADPAKGLVAVALAATCGLLATALLVRPTELAPTPAALSAAHAVTPPAASSAAPALPPTDTGVPDAATVFAGREVDDDEPAPGF